MRRYCKKAAVLFFLVGSLSSFAVLLFSSQPPQGYTGAHGVYCTNCHLGNSLNNTGGSITVNGLPTTTFTAGSSYNFSITTTHSAADRRRFGYSIVALNRFGQPVGTFATTSVRSAINGDELSHRNAITNATATLQSYTYDSLTWTAPAVPAAGDDTVSFYYAGNAANGLGSSGDFIYAGSKKINIVTTTYTFTGNGNWSNAANWANNTLPPSNIAGSHITIVIDPPLNGECILDVPQTISSAANLVVKDGKKFRVLNNLTVK